MIEKWWLEPVVLELDGIGRYRVVRNTREAAQCLLEKWPVQDGTAYRTAIRTCCCVLRGEQPMDYARRISSPPPPKPSFMSGRAPDIPFRNRISDIRNIREKLALSLGKGNCHAQADLHSPGRSSGPDR